jgi:hypothetical protein
MSRRMVAVRRAAILSLSEIEIARAPSEGRMGHQQLFFCFW